MNEHISLLLKVFRIELEEVENDVVGLLDIYAKRFNNHEITPYVWMENQALLKKELGCVKELERDLASWKPDLTRSAHDVLEELKSYLKGLAVERGYPELVGLVIERIGEKVIRYMEYDIWSKEGSWKFNSKN